MWEGVCRAIARRRRMPPGDRWQSPSSVWEAPPCGDRPVLKSRIATNDRRSPKEAVLRNAVATNENRRRRESGRHGPELSLRDSDRD